MKVFFAFILDSKSGKFQLTGISKTLITLYGTSCYSTEYPIQVWGIVSFVTGLPEPESDETEKAPHFLSAFSVQGLTAKYDCTEPNHRHQTIFYDALHRAWDNWP